MCTHTQDPIYAYIICSVSLRHDLIFRARYYIGLKTRTERKDDSRPRGGKGDIDEDVVR